MVSLVLLIVNKGDVMKYVYQGQIKKLPQKWKFKNGSTTGNFDLLNVEDHILEGWFPITILTGEVYDPSTQHRSAPVVTEYEDHAEVSYIISNIPPEQLRSVQSSSLKLQGRQKLYGKYDIEARERVFAGIDSPETYKLDLQTIRNYWRDVLNPALQNAQTGAEILAINTKEGSLYSWPLI